MPARNKTRCPFFAPHEELWDYHDTLWGQPTHDDQRHFEALAICVLHAGLGWIMVLKKLPALRRAFANFDPVKVAKFDEADLERLLQTEGLIRNRVKLSCVIHDARQFVQIQREFGSFDAFLWPFVHNAPLDENSEEGKAHQIAQKLSTELKKRGFKFVGPGTCFGLMEDVGLINPHDPSCYLAIK